MINYTYTFSTSGDVQTAHTNGELGNPYVAYITSTSGLDWNSLNIPQPSYKGEWSSEGTVYTFTVLNDSTSLWTDDVLIGTINGWYMGEESESKQGNVNIYLKIDSDWTLAFISTDGEYNYAENLYEAEEYYAENLSIRQASDPTAENWIDLNFTLNDNAITFNQSTNIPLNLTTINPEE